MSGERQHRPHQAVLNALWLSNAIEQGDLNAARSLITEAAAETLQVERVSIWMFDEPRTTLRCIELFQRIEHQHSVADDLRAADYPQYFRTLCQNRTVPADDARSDARTSEFAESYLQPLGITSMLDAPVRVDGKLVGVVCHEHVGPARHWTLAEQAFAGSIADIVAVTLLANRRRQAEKEVECQSRFLRQLIDINPNLIFVKDREGRYTLVNEAVADLFGLRVEDMLGMTEFEVVRDHDSVTMRRRVEQEVMDTRCEHISTDEPMRDSNGKLHWFQTVRRPVIEADGSAKQVLGVAVDITERKLAQEFQELMVRELDHRVKNNLSTVLGLAEHTFAGATTIDDFLEAFTGRVRSMAVAHELLAKTNWQGAELTEMIQRLVRPYQGSDDRERVRINGPQQLLPPRIAPSLSMMIHELVTNAVKHGALSSEGGTVNIQWEVAADRLLLNWTERGGPQVSPPSHSGFGRELIERVAVYQLRGEASLEFRRSGLHCAITIPLTDEPTTPCAVSEAQRRE